VRTSDIKLFYFSFYFRMCDGLYLFIYLLTYLLTYLHGCTVCIKFGLQLFRGWGGGWRNEFTAELIAVWPGAVPEDGGEVSRCSARCDKVVQ